MLAADMAEPFDNLLKATARSFYLTLRVLPSPVRSQIGLAYLLARTTDTIADTEVVPLERRLEALQQLRERILGRATAPLDFATLVRGQESTAEKALLERVDESLTGLRQLSAEDRKLVEEVLLTITSGQELDLQRFGGAERALSPSPEVVALATAVELDDYTYRVAGCVGEFWTKLCRAHLFPRARLDEQQLIADGVRFGKGLQLVNILRDLPSDLRSGRCYLPMEELTAAALSPRALLAPATEAAFLRVYRLHLDQAEAHLAAGWRYTNTLPFGQFRVRLACAWPILLGLRTIARLRTAGIAELQCRVKVSRGEVYALMIKSILVLPAPVLWRGLYASALRR